MISRKSDINLVRSWRVLLPTFVAMAVTFFASGAFSETSKFDLCRAAVSKSAYVSPLAAEHPVVVQGNSLTAVGVTEEGKAVAIGYDQYKFPQIWTLSSPQNIPQIPMVVIPRVREQPTDDSCMTEATINALRFVALNNDILKFTEPETAKVILETFPDPNQPASYTPGAWHSIHSVQFKSLSGPFTVLRRLVSGKSITNPFQQDEAVAKLLQIFKLRVKISEDENEAQNHIHRGLPAIVSAGAGTVLKNYAYRSDTKDDVANEQGLEPENAQRLFTNGKRTLGNHAIVALRPIQDHNYEGEFPQVLVLDSGDGLQKVYNQKTLFNKKVFLSAILIYPMNEPINEQSTNKKKN